MALHNRFVIIRRSDWRDTSIIRSGINTILYWINSVWESWISTWVKNFKF